MKKFFSWLLVIILSLSRISVTATPTVSSVAEDTAGALLRMVPSPCIGAVGGEWTILGLSRGGFLPENYAQDYYAQVKEALKRSDGVLSTRKYTEYARVSLALSAIGQYPGNVDGYNVLMPLTDIEATLRQGLNGPLWALIAFDAGCYNFPQNPTAKLQASRNAYISLILDREIPGGGFALASSATQAECDITAMALTALAPYRAKPEVDRAIARGLSFLSSIQNDNGSFSCNGLENAESCAQVLTALSSLAISERDGRFVKNGRSPLDALLMFYHAGQGFSHLASSPVDIMATEQALYALVALQRRQLGKNSLFDMTDEHAPSVLHSRTLTAYKTFDDIASLEQREAVEALAKRGIISGMTETTFAPGETMTRAAFAAMIVRALSLSLNDITPFCDVPATAWHAPYVGGAYDAFIVNGVSDTMFSPEETITREEAAVMIARAFALCMATPSVNTENINNFSDADESSPWARDALSLCLAYGLWDDTLRPKDVATRAEIAAFIYNLLQEAHLL